MSEQPNDGGPAFPAQVTQWDDDIHEYTHGHSMPGMTLRDWFAGQAIPAALVALNHEIECEQVSEGCDKYRAMERLFSSGKWTAWLATESYIIADAMLKAREGGAA